MIITDKHGNIMNAELILEVEKDPIELKLLGKAMLVQIEFLHELVEGQAKLMDELNDQTHPSIELDAVASTLRESIK